MAVYLTYKNPLRSEHKEFRLEDLKITNFDLNKMKGTILLDDDRIFQALYYSNIKDKVTRATFKSGKVIKVKTISNKDTIRRLLFERFHRMGLYG